MVIHLVTYAHKEPFINTQKTLNATINSKTEYNVCKHRYSINTLKNKSYYPIIKNIKKARDEVWDSNMQSQRDEHWHSWKPHIVQEVYELMKPTDILYYVDSSRWVPSGFDAKIDKCIEWCNSNKKSIYGSVGLDYKNATIDYMGRTSQAEKISTLKNVILDENKNNKMFLNQMHVLNAWFILVKNNQTTNVIKDWCKAISKPMNNIPAILHSLTADQLIWSIVLSKYKSTVFFDKNIKHIQNKNYNNIHHAKELNKNLICM